LRFAVISAIGIPTVILLLQSEHFIANSARFS